MAEALTVNLDLFFLEFSVDDTVSPGPDISHVSVLSAHSPPYAKGELVITPGCYGVSEIDGQIDRLHRELEEIRKQAHKRYAVRSALRNESR